MRAQNAVITEWATCTVLDLAEYAAGKGFCAFYGKDNDALFLFAVISLFKTEE